MTIAELCNASGLARSTIRARLSELESAGFISLTGAEQSSGGRPAGRYAINSGADLLVLTAHAGRGTIHAAVHTVAGTLLEDQGPRPVGEDCEDVLAAVRAAWTDLAGKTSPAGANVAACVLLIDDHPRARHQQTPGTILADRLTDEQPDGPRFTLTATRTSDALAIHAAAMAGNAGRNVLYVDRNTPESASWISNGIAQTGADGLAGTLLTSDEASRHARGLDPDGPSESGARNDGLRLGKALATCVAILNPSLILIGSEESQATAEHLCGVQEAIYTLAPPLAGRSLVVRAISNSPAAAMRAAHFLASEAALDKENVDELVRRAVLRRESQGVSWIPTMAYLQGT